MNAATERTVADTSSQKPPASSIEIRGSGWKVGVPAIIVTSLVAAVGARTLPTPTTSDRTLDKIETKLQIAEMRDEQFRMDIRRELDALRSQTSAANGELSNRLMALDAKVQRLSK